MSRPDGRHPASLRPLHLALGELDRADGSGRFAFGPTAALASFTGPIEVRLRDERVDRASLEIVHRPVAGVGGTPSRALVTTLEAVFTPLLALHAFPRALCQVVVQSLGSAPGAWPVDRAGAEEDRRVSWPGAVDREEAKEAAPVSGSALAGRAAALNAAALAAVHAGSVGMRGVPLAVALAATDAGVVVDPSAEEEAGARARFGFAWAFGAGVSAAPRGGVDGGEEEAELVWAEAEGEFGRDEFNAARDASLLATREILAFTRAELETFFSEQQRR